MSAFKVSQENWLSYKILLVNHKHKNRILQVCFPKNSQDNFAIVQDTEGNKNCEGQVILNILI